MTNKICIVAGEPISINSEIIARSWKKLNKFNRNNIFVIGCHSLLVSQFRRLKIKVPLNKIESLDTKFSQKKINILNIPLKFKGPFSINKNDSSNYVLKCLDKAHQLSISGKIKGFINCSVDKKNIFKSKNIGVTEYLAKKNNSAGKETMLIYNNKLSVCPLTTHINVKQITRSINQNLIIKKVLTLNNFYRKNLNKKPLIAILGLNPHNGELRKKSEEIKIIIPSIKRLRKRKINVIGPLPSDTVFSNQKKYQYDVIVGMYHDQVLGPFKALFGLNAINITLGLNYYRVSPDHGTAKDLVGLKKGDPTSLLSSINFITKI